MNGPEHYVQAEMLLGEAKDIPSNHDETNPAAALQLAAAQVHATLALAAALATNPCGEDYVPERNWTEYTAWAEVCAVVKPEVTP